MSPDTGLIVYHGCDVTTRDDLVSGRLAQLDQSNNHYDWLGPGTYFFEGDPERAYRFAEACASQPEKRYSARPISNPAVVGAVLQIFCWLDLTTQAGLRAYSQAYQTMVAGLAAAGAPVPKNRPASADDPDSIYRALDNAVFTWLHQSRANEQPSRPAYQAVRAAFHQGERLAPSSGFYSNTHVQIALRDNACVIGWFLPRGSALLSEVEYARARSDLATAAEKYKKPRIRV